MMTFGTQVEEPAIMTGDKLKSRRQSTSKGRRKYYVMTFDYTKGGKLGFSLFNRDRIEFKPPPGKRGFPDFAETPCAFFDKTTGRLPRDLEQLGAYWLITDRTKSVFESVDLCGFAFSRCDVKLSTGEYDGPPYWLCDVVRLCDALDETRSRLQIRRRGDPDFIYLGDKFYDISGSAVLVFLEEAIGDAHVFRMAHREPTVICDDALKEACNQAGLKGIRFRDAAKL